MICCLCYFAKQTAEINETRNRIECDDNDSFPKIPLFFAADSESRDKTINTCRQLTSALIAICKDEEELASVTGVLSDGKQDRQAEIHKEMGIIIKVEGIDSSQNGKNEANNKNKWSKFEDEAEFCFAICFAITYYIIILYYKNLSLVVLICLLIDVLLL